MVELHPLHQLSRDLSELGVGVHVLVRRRRLGREDFPQRANRLRVGRFLGVGEVREPLHLISADQGSGKCSWFLGMRIIRRARWVFHSCGFSSMMPLTIASDGDGDGDGDARAAAQSVVRRPVPGEAMPKSTEQNYPK